MDNKTDDVEVICAGLSCLDMLLYNCETPTNPETICRFTSTTNIPGGSVPNTARSLSQLQISVGGITLVGKDIFGDQIIEGLDKDGVDTSYVIRDENVATSLAVVPVFQSGGRGCFVNLGANEVLSVDRILARLPRVAKMQTLPIPSLRVFHFGYPHLLPKVQGDAFKEMLIELRRFHSNVIISVDVNGANVSEREGDILTSALPLIGIMHGNFDEACKITATDPKAAHEGFDKSAKSLPMWFTERGVGIACITCGERGVYASTHASSEALLETHNLPWQIEASSCTQRPAYRLSGTLDSTGAGDAFSAGCIAALIKEENCTLERLLDAGLASSLQRIDSARASNPLAYPVLMHELNLAKRLHHQPQTYAQPEPTKRKRDDAHLPPSDTSKRIKS